MNLLDIKTKDWWQEALDVRPLVFKVMSSQGGFIDIVEMCT